MFYTHVAHLNMRMSFNKLSSFYFKEDNNTAFVQCTTQMNEIQYIVLYIKTRSDNISKMIDF